MKMSREIAFPSKHTFTIPPIVRLLARYVGNGQEWVDPFAGEHSPAEVTNDLNTSKPTMYHMLALDFCTMIQGPFKGVLFDPPYSYTQIKECYEGVGLKAYAEDTNSGFYKKVKNAIRDKIEPGGLAISFGWTSEGFGAYRGFKLIEVLLVCHCGHANDTIVTVEQKIQSSFYDF